DGYLACDLVDLGRPATKWATRISSSDQFLRVLRQAWSCANSVPRGPVLVAIPMDVLEQPVDGEPTRTPTPFTRTIPHQPIIPAMSAGLAGAKHPIILIGDALAWSGAKNEVLELAELLGARIYGLFLTMAGRMLSEPRFGGFLPLTSGAAVAETTYKADAVL